MIKIFVLYVLFIFSHSFVNSQSTIGLGDVMLTSLDSDVSRSFIYSRSSSPAYFDFTGYSNLGTILNTSNIFKRDTISYKLSSTLGLASTPLTFYLQYFNDSDYQSIYDDINEFVPNCITSIFMPTFIVEYEEINDQDGFQYGSDRFLGYVNLAQLQYEVDYTLVYYKAPSFFGDAQIFQLNITSIGDYENLITIVLYFSSYPANLGDGKIMSSELLRFDILINDYFNSDINKQSSNECIVNSNGNGNDSDGGGGGGGGDDDDNGDNGSPIKIGCISTGASNNLNSRLAVTSFFAVLEYDISMNNNGGENKINIDGFSLAASFSWLPTAKVNVDNEISVANIYTDTHNINTNDAIIFGSNFIPVAITGNVNSKFLIQSFDVERPNVVLWTSYFGIPSKHDTNNSNNINSTFSINLIIIIIIISLILFTY
ncbi:hypothetical protein ACTFIZ_011540 [Dictyostelium cf. discoideum]